MVRVRVAARIFPEDEYLKNVHGGKVVSAPVKDEKRLVVLVRNPYEWQTGTLMLEIQRAYRSTYQRDLPTIKYLKDADDYDIDPQSFVSDTLLDEGRAQTDTSDQRVTVNVILEQGRRLREGSVAVGSQLEDPRFQLQLEENSRPPVPSFPGLASSLGKRTFPSDPRTVTGGTKRARHVEVPDTIGEEHELLSSIEHDEPADAVELVRGTQYSNPEQEYTYQPGQLRLKAESPELGTLLQDIPAATADELEILPQQPQNFVPSKRSKKKSTTHQSPRQVQTQPTALPLPANRRQNQRSQAPITPPSETSRVPSNSSRIQEQRSQDAAKSAAQLSSTSASKFMRHDVYDYPESEIDDSQMSPRSKQNLPSNRKTSGHLSSIERLESPQADQLQDQGLSISQALDALDDESVFEEVGSVNGILKSTEVTSDESRSDSDEAEISIYEDPENRKPEQTDQQHGVAPKAETKATTNGITGDKPSKPASSKTGNTTFKDGQASNTAITVAANKPTVPMDIPPAKRSRTKKKRKSDDISLDGDAQAKVTDANTKGQQNKKTSDDKSTPGPQKSAKKVQAGQKTPSLDSPGEQLSQSLQASTKKVPMEAVNKKLTAAKKKAQTTTPGKDNKLDTTQSADKTAGGESAKTPATARAANKIPEKQDKTTLKSSLPPSIVVQRATEPVTSSPALPETLPNRGSDAPTLAEAEKNMQGQQDKLNVDQQDDPRKSPSVCIGLSPEEMRILETRKNMTEEQYLADKKQKQLENRKQAEEQRKQEALAKKNKRKSINEDQVADEPKAEPEKEAEKIEPVAPKKKKARQSLSKDEKPEASLERTTTQTSTTTSGTGKSTPSTKKADGGKATPKASESTTSSSSNVDKVSAPTAKVPAKQQSTKSPSLKSANSAQDSKTSSEQPKAKDALAKPASKASSVKSANINKTPKPADPKAKTGKTPNAISATKSAPNTSSVKKVESKSTEKTPVQPQKSAGLYTKTLSDLRKDMQKSEMGLTAPKPSLLSRIKQTQKTPVFEIDDDDDDEASEESSEEEVKPKTTAKATKVPQTKTPVPTKQRLEDSGESSEESSEQEAKITSSRVATPSSAFKSRLSAQPDPSIRDKSVDSDDDDDDD